MRDLSYLWKEQQSAIKAQGALNNNCSGKRWVLNTLDFSCNNKSCTRECQRVPSPAILATPHTILTIAAITASGDFHLLSLQTIWIISGTCRYTLVSKSSSTWLKTKFPSHLPQFLNFREESGRQHRWQVWGVSLLTWITLATKQIKREHLSAKDTPFPSHYPSQAESVTLSERQENE